MAKAYNVESLVPQEDGMTKVNGFTWDGLCHCTDKPFEFYIEADWDVLSYHDIVKIAVQKLKEKK